MFFFATLTLALFTSAIASPSQPLWQRVEDVQAAAADRVGLPEQQVFHPAMGNDNQTPPSEFQSTTTQTHSTAWYPVPSTSVKAPRCNTVACASCRSFYACRNGEPECFQCDASPYCRCEASELRTVRKTCSLGPGRTVPCDALQESSEKIYVFPSAADDAAAASEGAAIA
nr:hypothetical protein CFP56_41505 [Quercus suber]